jgi:glycosyltransferase involved in cell wall biosynthesis
MTAVRTPILCLTLYPISSRYKALVEESVGHSVEYLQVADLRQLSKRCLFKHLLSNKCKTIILPCEVPETESTLPILQILAAAHRMPSIMVSNPQGDLARIPYPRIATDSIRLLVASLHGWLSRKRNTRHAKTLANTDRPATTQTSSIHRILYIKNNMWFGIRAGGSVGHVAGVINAFSQLGHDVAFVSPEAPKYLDDDIALVPVSMFKQFGIPAESNLFRIHNLSLAAARTFSKSFSPTMIYQRLSVGDFVGAQLAAELKVPLVVEYNGSEVWVAENWGRGLRYKAACIAAEDAMLHRADLVFTISEPLRDELLDRGVKPDRVHWYPNCVNPEIYDAARWTDEERMAVRATIGADNDSFVLTFVGTFGQWHGAEVLAEAAVQLCQDTRWRDGTNVYFLFIGDGVNRALCENIISGTEAEGVVHFTGLLPQHITPKYMAASDAFVAPHVPNSDGTRFFGSPTKLFEYMAMGKPIVASALDQLEDILEDGKTAYLVKPGDAASLAGGIQRLLADRDGRSTVGEAALAVAHSEYTWIQHATKILNGLNRNDRTAGTVSP